MLVPPVAYLYDGRTCDSIGDCVLRCAVAIDLVTAGVCRLGHC